MRRVYLCGHTGSENRGCEAILRSTAALLRRCGQDEIRAMTMDLEYDRRLGLEKQLTLIAYPQRPLPVKAVSYLRRKLLKDGVWAGRCMYRPMFQEIEPGDVIFNVGGDTYCYGTPSMSYALNEMAEEKGIPTVFWGCSVDERVLTDRNMQNDINRYRAIVARESLSYDLLREVVSDPGKVYLACDPAFELECVSVQLPKHFQPSNTVGVNISPLVLGGGRNEDDRILRNVFHLIDNILENTDMHVCLIPHVYDPERNTEDIRVLRIIFRRYQNNSRVSLIEASLSCTQLKYIVSQCRFFVGARTHPTIAAYSSGVPALAISYSVKSLGIARDILGSEELYAVPWKTITAEDELWKRFSSGILANEQAIIARYQQFLPEYCASAERIVKEILCSI